MDTQPAFYKMKMTGPRCAEMITQPLQAMRELNPNLNAMIQSTEQMNKVLCEASKQPLKKRRKIASSAVAIHDAHLQRLKAFRSGADYTFDPLVQALAQQPPSGPAAPPPHVEEETEEEDESSLGSSSAIRRVVEAVPQQFRARVAQLGKYLKAHPNLIRFTSSGRAIVGGMEIHNSNIIDVMRSIYYMRKGQPLPRGTKEVIQALHSVGVPSFLFSSAAARAVYHGLQEAGEQFHAATQTERETEQELQHQELLKTPEGKHGEGGEEFATAQHLPFPPQQTVPTVVETAPVKPETKQFSGVPTKPEASKASSIPTKHGSVKPTAIRAKQVSSSEASQQGHGYKVNGERVCLPGKPIRILRLPSFPEKPARKVRTVQKSRGLEPIIAMGPAGKPIRILRLY